jgi:hypothetical protein
MDRMFTQSSGSGFSGLEDTEDVHPIVWIRIFWIRGWTGCSRNRLDQDFLDYRMDRMFTQLSGSGFSGLEDGQDVHAIVWIRIFWIRGYRGCSPNRLDQDFLD